MERPLLTFLIKGYWPLSAVERCINGKKNKYIYSLHDKLLLGHNKDSIWWRQQKKGSSRRFCSTFVFLIVLHSALDPRQLLFKKHHCKEGPFEPIVISSTLEFIFISVSLFFYFSSSIHFNTEFVCMLFCSWSLCIYVCICIWTPNVSENLMTRLVIMKN